MMKKILLIALLYFPLILKAQINERLLDNTWIKVNATYNNNAPIAIDNIMRYSYARYIFTDKGEVKISIDYQSPGNSMQYFIDDSTLNCKSQFGYVANKLKIAKLTTDELILVQAADNNFKDPAALYLHFIPESVFQKKFVLKPADIYRISNNDTVYNESRMIHAEFKSATELQNYMYQQNPGSMDGRQGLFKIAFTVSKTGVADSVKILSSIDVKYDKIALKWIEKYKSSWAPATYNGKPVAVRMTVEQRYMTSITVAPHMRFTREANNAYDQQDYEHALYFYEMALKQVPDDVENLYKKVVCKIMLNHAEGLCADLTTINNSGKIMVDEIIAVICKDN